MAVLISHNNTEAVNFSIPTFITFAAGKPLERPGLPPCRSEENGGQWQNTHDALSYSSVAVIDGAVDCWVWCRIRTDTNMAEKGYV